MRIDLKRVMVAVIGITLLMTGLVFASSTNSSPGGPAADYSSVYVSGQASTLLSKIQQESAALTRHSESLDTYTRQPRLSWQTHAESLTGVKEHINAVGQHLAELQEIQHLVAPSQKQAIAEVTSHAVQVAESTQAAILYLSDNLDRFFVQEYRDHLTTIADRSDMMKQTVDKYLDFEKTQQKLERLQNELELAQS